MIDRPLTPIVAGRPTAERDNKRFKRFDAGAQRNVPIGSMTQTNNPFLDEFARLMTDAAGAAQGVRREFEALMKAQAERMLRGMDVVQREEFEAVKEMAARAREANDALAARVAALEAEIAALKRG